MSDLINKYIEARDVFMDELVRCHKLHLMFMAKQSPNTTRLLRKGLKQLRASIKEMERLSQERMRERQTEWAAEHPARGINNNERYNRSNQGSS